MSGRRAGASGRRLASTSAAGNRTGPLGGAWDSDVSYLPPHPYHPGVNLGSLL